MKKTRRIRINIHILIFFSALILGSAYNYSFLNSILQTSQSIPVTIGTLALNITIIYFALECLCLIFGTKATLIFMFLVAGISSYYMDSLGIGIGVDIMHSIFNSNPREFKESISFGFLMRIFFLSILPILIIVWGVEIKRQNFLSVLKSKILIMFACVLAFCAIWFGGVGKEVIFLFKKNNALYELQNPISPIRSSIRYTKEKFKAKREFRQIALDATKVDGKKPKIMILVIGESARSQNYWLNGYTRNTNPYTSKLKHLVNFKEFYSCGIITAISVPCMLTNYTHSTYDQRDLSFYVDSILDITERIGIDTWWISNNGGSCMGKVCERIKNIKYYNHGGIDGEMLGFIEEVVDGANKDTFIIVNIVGSHGQEYHKRYPKEFEKFTPVCDTKEIQRCDLNSLTNAYDNSILYTDFFVYKNIEILKSKSGFETTLWYVSDHGESLGENGNYMHGGLPYLIAPEAQKHIPSMIWTRQNDIFSRLKSKENKTLNHDYVFHTILGIFGIKTSIYEKSLDLTN